MNKYIKKALRRIVSLTLVASLISTNIDVAAASEKTEGLVSFDGKYFDTFEEAVTEANDSALTSVTIYLYGDVEVSDCIKLKNKEYIIKGVESALDEDGEGGHTKIKYNITNEDEKKDYPIFEMDGSKVEFDSVSICGKGLDKNNKMYGDVIEANKSYINLYNSTIMDFKSTKSIINMKDSSINMDKISGISGNAFDGYGCIHGEGTCRIKDGSIDNNIGGRAGGIYSEGPIYLEDTNVFGNKGSEAGGIYAKDSLYTKGVTVYKNSNSSYNEGGGITIDSKNDSELINTRIANNNSYTYYGGLRILGSGNVDLFGVKFFDNLGKFSVGAIDLENKDATLTFRNKGRYDSIFGEVDCDRNEIGHQADDETIRNNGTIICDDVYIHNDRGNEFGTIKIKDNGNFILGRDAEINDTIVLEKDSSILKIKDNLQYHNEINPIRVKYSNNLGMSLPKTVAYIDGSNKEELGYDILSKKLLLIDEERIPDSAYLEYRDGKIELSSDVKKIKIKAKNKKGEAVKGVSFELYLVKSIEYDDNGEVKSCKSTKVKRTESTDDNGEVLLSGFGAGKYRLVTVGTPSEYSSGDTKDVFFDLLDDDKNLEVIIANRDYSPTAVIRGFINDDNEDSDDEDDDEEENNQNTGTETQEDEQQQGDVLDSKNGKESKINENICFNAGDSSDDEGIVSFTWDFGDGSEQESGKIVNHRYQKAGTYTVNLIITDSKGQKSVASTKFKVSGVRNGESGVDLYIYDSQTLNGVKNLNVYIYDENGNQVYANAQKTDSDGKLNIALKPGKYSLKASNSMYPIRMKSFIVSGNTDISMPINSVTAAESKIEIHDLSYSEMVEAGIDVNNIGNVSFAGFKIELDFDTEYEANKNHREKEDLEYIVYYNHSAQKWEVNGKKAKEIEAVELDPDHVLIYDSGFKWEKEIFEVKLLTINNSKTDTIKNAYAKIDFNDKVTYAVMDEESENQNFEVKKVDDVKPGEVAVTSWYLRGENEGDAEIGVETYGDFCSDGNEPQPFSSYAHINKDIHIVNVKDFKFEVKCNKYAYSDEEYKVELRVRNQSGRKLSNFTLYNASRMQVSADYLTELEKGEDDVFVKNLSSYGSVSLTFRTKFKSAYSEEQLKYELLRLVFTIYDGFSSDIPADVEISKSDVVSACDYAGIDYDSMPKPKAADPVDLLTGSFTYDYKDLELSGKESLTYERYYNSNDNLNEKFVFDENDDTKTIKNHLSEGWSDNYSYAIEKMYVDENKEELELIDFSEKADDENTSDQNSDKEELSSESATKGEMICMTLPKGERVYFSAPKKSEEDNTNESESTYENNDIKYVQYLSRKGSNFTLYETENKYVVISNFGKTYVFNHKGQIECIKKSNENIFDELKVAESDENTYNDFNDNEVVFTYDDCYLKKVKSVAGELKFNYDLAGKIIDVTGNDNYIVRLSYDKGNLKKITDADGGVTEYIYYDNNLLKSIKSPDKIKLFENTYDDYGRVIKQVVDEKEVYTFTYENKFEDVNTSANMTNTVTGPNGYIKKIVTDNDGRTVSETENGKKTTYTYNDNNLLFTKTDADGNVTKYYYDDNGHNNKIKYADGLFEKFEYDAKGRLLSKTGKSKVTEYYNYDKYGNLTSYTNGVGEVALYEYDKNGNLILMTDYMGAQSKFTYDKKGNVLSYVDAQDNTISFTYDDRGLIESKKNPDGNSEEYEYSKAGKLLSVTDYSGNKETYDLSDAGVKLGITDKRGNKTSIFYDERDRKNGVKTAEGRETKYAYDSASNIEKITDALGYSLNYEYDSDGNVTKYTDNAGNEYVYSYNNDGSVKSYIDPLNNKYNYFYDTNGNLKKSENPDGSSEKYDYDALGNVIKITDANGNEEKYERNNLGLVTKFTDKNGHETSYEYNAFGKVSVITNPNGEKLLCSYDTLGYLSSVKREDGSLKKYEYDTLGRVSGLTNYNGDKTSYEYDEIGNVKKIIYPDGSNDEFSYDENSNLTEYKDRNNKVFKYEYDKDNNLTKKINPNNDEITYERNKLSQISKITDENGEIVSFIYDANGNVKKKIDSKGNEECYKYNFNGKIVEITDKEGVKTSLERDYKGNITKITDGNKNVNEYYYDSASNLVKSIDGEGNTTTYKYDKNGNLIEKNSPEKIKYTYKYDSNDMLIEELVEDKTINKYEYDSNGNVSKRITGEGAEYSFEYDGEGNVTGEIDPYGDKIEYRYDSDGRIVEIVDKNGNIKTCERDNNGNIVLSSDTNGVLTKYEYDSLGNLIKQIENYNENTYKDVDKKTLDDNKKEQEKTGLNKNINRSISDTKNNSSKSYKINKLKIVNVDVKISKLSDKKLLKILGIKNIKKISNKKLKKTSGKILNKINKYLDEKIDKQIRKNILKKNNKNKSYEIISNGKYVKGYSKTMSNLSYRAYNMVDKVYINNLNKKSLKSKNLKSQLIAPRSKAKKKTHKISVTVLVNDDEEHSDESDSNLISGISSFEYSKSKLSMDEKTDSDDDLKKNNNSLKSYEELKKENLDENVVTTYKYDKVGNLLEEDRCGNVTTYEYDKNYNVSSKVDANGVKTVYKYDKNDRLIKSYNSDNGGDYVSLSYDNNGNVIKVTKKDRKNDKTSTEEYNYDNNNNVISKKDALNNEFSISYDKDGKVSKTVDATGKKTTYSYNSIGNVTKKEITDGNNTLTNKYGYNKDGVLTSYENDTNKTSYELDLLNRIIKVTDEVKTDAESNEVKDVIDYEYSKLDKISKITNNDGNYILYDYDNVGNIKHIESKNDDNVENINYSYDNLNRVISKNIADSVNIKYTYDENNKVTSIWKNDECKHLYTRDANGNVLTDNDKEYTYDDSNRLKTYVSKNENIKYDYDGFGNLVEENDTLNNIKTNYEYNEVNELIKKTVSANSSNDVVTYEYDNNGNRISEKDKNGIKTFAYNLYDKVESVAYQNNNNEKQYDINYKYDALENLISEESIDLINDKTIKREYTVESMSGLGSVLFETRKETGLEEKHINNVYDESGKVIENINDKSYAVIENALGSIEEFVNVDNDEDISSVSYSPWGDIKDMTNNSLDAMDLVSYTGYGYNALSNLYLAVNRIYDVTTRSYMQRDKGQPTAVRPSSFETYAYVENNPVNYVDPYGLSIISKVGSWVSDTADAFVSTVKKAAGTVKDAVVDAAEGIKDAVVDVAHELVTDVKKVLNIDSRIFKTGIQTGVGAALSVAMGIGLPAAIVCALGAVAAGAVLGIGAHAVKTFATGGTYDDFLCGLEDSIYSGADFMSALFMTTAMAGYGECKKIDKMFEVDDFISKNVHPSFQKNVKEAFDSDVKVTTLEKDTIVFRYHGGGSSGKSYWYTPYQTKNPASDLALPPGNTYEYMDTYIIPKGTTIIEGTVAKNFGQPGGGYQYYVPDPDVVLNFYKR